MFLTLWVVGFILAIVVGTMMYKERVINKFLLFTLITLSIVLAEGIAGGWWIREMINSGMISEIKETGITLTTIFQLAVVMIVPITLIWCVGYKLLELNYFKFRTRLTFFIVFIISMIIWVLII